jgi:hypothetical protein
MSFLSQFLIEKTIRVGDFRYSNVLRGSNSEDFEGKKRESTRCTRGTAVVLYT